MNQNSEPDLEQRKKWRDAKVAQRMNKHLKDCEKGKHQPVRSDIQRDPSWKILGWKIKCRWCGIDYESVITV